MLRKQGSAALQSARTKSKILEEFEKNKKLKPNINLGVKEGANLTGSIISSPTGSDSTIKGSTLVDLRWRPLTFGEGRDY